MVDIVCDIMNWSSTRIAQDSVIWKPPGSGPVYFHQDCKYISDQFIPRQNNSVTMWVSLDQADQESGIVEYAQGSHLWDHESIRHSLEDSTFHGGSDNYRNMVEKTAQLLHMEPQDLLIEPLQTNMGDIILHHQDTWHGSGPNISQDRDRRALAIHFLQSDVKFIESPSYIYGRYKLPDTNELLDCFFPTVV